MIIEGKGAVIMMIFQENLTAQMYMYSSNTILP